MLGVALSVFTIGTLFRMAQSLMNQGSQRADGFQRTLLVTALKLPVSLALIFFGTQLSGAGIACFLVAIALVYSSFIGFRSFSDA